MKKILAMALSVILMFAMLSTGITAFAAAGDVFDMTMSVTLSNALPEGYTLWVNGNFHQADPWTTIQLESADGTNFTATVEDAIAASGVEYSVYWSPTDTMQDWSRKLHTATLDTTAGADGTYHADVTFNPPSADSLFDMDITVNLANALPAGYTLWINGDFSGAGSGWTSYVLSPVGNTTYTVTVPAAAKIADMKYAVYVSSTDSDRDIEWNNKLVDTSFNTTAGAASSYMVSVNNPVIDPENTFAMDITLNLTKPLDGDATLWISANFVQDETAWGTYQLTKVGDMTYSLNVKGVKKAEYTDYKVYMSADGTWEGVDWLTEFAAGSFNTLDGVDGLYTINVENGTVEPTGKGDVNGDGAVDSKDARLVLQFAVSAVSLTEAQKVAGDMNGDNVVDSKDAREILQLAVA